MSVRAYLEKNLEIESNNEELIITKTLKRMPTFNVTRQPEIFELFCEYGEDYTNDDCVGEISISKSEWEKVPKDRLPKKTVNQINKDFQSRDEITYHCL